MKDRDPATTSSPRPPSPGLYLVLASVVWIIAAAAAALFRHALGPFAALHPPLGAAAAAAVISFVCISGLFLAFEALSAAVKRDLLGFIPLPIRRTLLMIPYPACRALGRAAARSEDAVAASCIALMNLHASWARTRVAGRALLVVLPRCLQRAECERKVVESVLNCARCGKCDLAQLRGLQEKHGFSMAVVTGGRRAKRMVRDLRPSGVIAVACERELMEGLRDSAGIPVIGVVNRRPEGPCRNTAIDAGEFIAALRALGLPEG